MDKTFSIAEFCADEGLSLSFFYKLDRLGKAPATFKVGKLRRMTREAREAWRADRQAESIAA
jgi:lipopolysaccharide/colanic/teichoic acid biosynthesis glycosyltransferase